MLNQQPLSRSRALSWASTSCSTACQDKKHSRIAGAAQQTAIHDTPTDACTNKHPQALQTLKTFPQMRSSRVLVLCNSCQPCFRKRPQVSHGAVSKHFHRVFAILSSWTAASLQSKQSLLSRPRDAPAAGQSSTAHTLPPTFQRQRRHPKRTVSIELLRSYSQPFRFYSRAPFQ